DMNGSGLPYDPLSSIFGGILNIYGTGGPGNGPSAVQMIFGRAITQDLVIINSDALINQFLYLAGYINSSNSIVAITNPVANITYSNPSLSTIINSQFNNLIIVTTSSNFTIPGIYSVLASASGTIFTYGTVTATLTTLPAPGILGLNFTPGIFIADPTII